MPSGIVSKLNTTLFSSFGRVITGQRNTKDLLIGQGILLSRSSGLSFFLPYSTTLLPDISRLSSSCSRKGKSMAASSSKSVFGDVYVDDVITSCGNVLDFTKPFGVFFNDRSRSSCHKASVSFKRKEPLNCHLACGYFVADVTRRNCSSNILVGPWLRNLHTSFSICHSASAAHDVSFDGNSRDEQLMNSSILSQQYVFLLICFVSSAKY